MYTAGHYRRLGRSSGERFLDDCKWYLGRFFKILPEVITGLIFFFVVFYGFPILALLFS